MYFKTLKEKCEYYRSLTDHKLLPNSYTLVMVDGHKFSKMIKNKFEKPFDDTFIKMMNETAQYLCSQIQGAKFAYTQSDEISILITDFDTPMTDSFFSYRICKIQSLVAAMATSKFNQLYFKYVKGLKEVPLCTFDCKVWTVPNANDAYAWFLFRQTDCIKNSKAQTAQTYIPHDKLKHLTADEMIAKLNDEQIIDWNMFPNDRKFGRLVFKVDTQMETTLPNGEHKQFTRSPWTAVPAEDFKVDDSMIKSLIPE